MSALEAKEYNEISGLVFKSYPIVFVYSCVAYRNGADIWVDNLKIQSVRILMYGERKEFDATATMMPTLDGPEGQKLRDNLARNAVDFIQGQSWIPGWRPIYTPVKVDYWRGV